MMPELELRWMSRPPG